MLFYPTLADYLQNKALRVTSDSEIQLRGSDRPFLELTDNEELTQKYGFLIERDQRIYEVGFPWVQVSDWASNHNFSKGVTVETKQGEKISFRLKDEVFDETQLSNDENTLQRLKSELGLRCDRLTAETINIFIGLFTAFSSNYQAKQCYLLKLPDCLSQLSQEDARLPLVLALNKRYELRHKLEMIAPKLRSQLNRNAEMMPLGHIQEMDAYCLRDYVRRPGKNAVEKAGARQELMGIQRYQNFNTPENRFLKGFCDLLHLDCRDYRERYSEAKTLERAIDKFRNEPSVKSIPRTATFTGKPNYVLQQNPIYRSFYLAYQDYLQRRTDKEKLWGFRQALLVDVVAMLWVAALLNLEGSYLQPLAQIEILDVPKEGRYLADLKQLTVTCFLQTAVFQWAIARTLDSKKGDLELTVTRQKITENEPKIYSANLCIWVFWYQPSRAIFEGIKQSSNPNFPVLIYLDNLPEAEGINELENEINVLQLPHPLEENLEAGVNLLTEKICEWFQDWL